MGGFKFNQAGLNEFFGTVTGTWEAVMKDLDNEYTDVINDPNEFADVGLPNRDIVDTGRFRDSQQRFKFRRGRDRIINLWQWNPVSPDTGERYARKLYIGFLTSSAGGRGFIPGRRWPERALKRIKPALTLANRLRRQGFKVKVNEKTNLLER